MQPRGDFVDDIAEPRQVLFDAGQPPLGFDLFGFEATDPGRFLEDRSAVLRIGLQHPIDFALLDQAVGVDPDAGAADQIAGRLSSGRGCR